MSEDPEFALWKASQPSEDHEPPPIPKPHLSIYWQAWAMIKGDRHYDGSGNMGPIYYATISSYARDHNITGLEFEIFKRFIRAMDDKYLTFERTRKKPTE